MRSIARSIRLLLSVLWIAPAVLLPVWMYLEIGVDPNGRCNFGGCWQNNRHHAGIVFLLFFPPGWAAFLTLTLRDHRHLSWAQYFIMSIGTLVLTQIMAWIWVHFVYLPSLQQLWLNPVDWLTPIFLMASAIGFVMIWNTSHTALTRLPRPLGQAGEDWWFGGDPYPTEASKD